MSGLVLLGASGLAREVLATLRVASRPDPVGILDDDPSRWGSFVDGVRVLGGTALVARHPEWSVLSCVGQGTARRAIRQRLTEAGVAEHRWATVLHPHVVVPPGCDVGRGSIVLAGAVLTADVLVGLDVVVMPSVVLTHDVVVTDHATLCAGVCLSGGVTVGSAAYLGTRSAVREGVTVGAGSTLGMGSVLLRDLPPDETWAGVPARPLAPRPSQAPRTAPRTASSAVPRRVS